MVNSSCKRFTVFTLKTNKHQKRITCSRKQPQFVLRENFKKTTRKKPAMDDTIIKVFTFFLFLKIITTEMYGDYPDNDYANQNYNTKDPVGQLYNEKTSGAHVPQSNLGEHAMVTDSNVFPYMATVLKGNKYINSGALIDQNWVLTTADGLFLMGESIRFLRIRLGSINYKKGGVLLPVKLLEIHPYFDDRRPNFDLALIMLAKPVRYTPNLRAIRMQKTPREVTATHFIVTSWPGALESKSSNISHLQSMEMIKRHRILTVTHLHPSDPQECAEELMEIGGTKDAIMCLDPTPKDPCMRDTGAPVVLNNVLWAIVSSWKPDDCDEVAGGPIFATLVSPINVSSWIHATVHGHRWKQS